MAGANPDYDLFQLSEEHEALREAVRDMAEDRIAPRAAEIDETGEFPKDVYESLAAAGFHAIHIPESYGGQGGDQLASAIVTEEVARVCGSSSLIPAVNKLGTTPLLVGGDEAIKQRYLPEVASGEVRYEEGGPGQEGRSDAPGVAWPVSLVLTNQETPPHSSQERQDGGSVGQLSEGNIREEEARVIDIERSGDKGDQSSKTQAKGGGRSRG